MRTPDQHARRLLLLVPFLAACIESDWIVCADGRVCEAGQICDLEHHICTAPTNDCLDKNEFATCDIGICRDGVCQASCGDGIVNGTDECEGDIIGRTCVDFQKYAGVLSCRDDCTIDDSRCYGSCGDESLDLPYETCDPSDLRTTSGISCTSLGFDAGREGCATDCLSLNDEPCMTLGWTLEDPVPSDASADALLDIWGTGDDLFILTRPGGVRAASAQGWVPVGADGEEIPGTALWASSSGDIWVLDYETPKGYTYHWNGSVWVWEPGPKSGLNDIWGASPADVFAVGDDGIVAFFNGDYWDTLFTPAETGDLHAVSGTSATDVYAVGEAGTLLHYDGDVWSPMESGTNENLLGVWADRSGEIWTIGPESVRRFRDGAWSSMLSLDGTAPGRAWISGTGPNDIWISAQRPGTVMRYDGARWSVLLAGDASGPQPLWVDRVAAAVGFQYGNGNGRVRRWDGAGPGPLLAGDGYWRDAWAFAPDDWIAVGYDDDNRGKSLHPDGTIVDLDEALLSVTGFASGRIVAGGDRGTLYEWNGQWTELVPGSGLAIVDLWTAGEDLYVLTAADPSDEGPPSRVLRDDGQSWSELPPFPAPCGRTGLQIWASGPDDVFVVGQNLAAHFDGEAWKCLYPGDGTRNYPTVWGAGPGDVWVLSNQFHQYTSVLYHWDGKEFLPFPGAEWLTLIRGVSGPLVGTAADDIFLGGTAHFDGRVWSPLRTSAMGGLPVFALPSRLLMIEVTDTAYGLGQFIRTRFWNQRPVEADCADGVDDDADGASDASDSDCAAPSSARGQP